MIWLRFLPCLLLFGCGYHLVGQGNDAGLIQSNETIYVQADQGLGKILSQKLIRELKKRGYNIIEDANLAGVALHLQHSSETLVPSAYDSTGLAVQYRLMVQADVSLWRKGEEIWRADRIVTRGDVFASGGPTDIEAQKNTVAKQLYQAWVRQCLAQLQSGF
ncbi:MAG: LptE family protein [Mariprofundaceae bacterium]|nr:LptE family protein [Mariprofundaceae bacterium]